MIKILILIAVVVLTTMIGVMLSAGKKKTMQVFAELYEFNEQLLLNLKYNRQPVEKIAAPFKFVPSILKGETVLDGAEGDLIKDYAENLGTTDALSQIDYLNGRKAILTKYRDESQQNYKKYSSLYVKIFFLAGVLVAILLA